MIGRVIVVGEMRGREVAALFVDGQIEDLLVEPAADAAPPAGAIYRAVVDRMVKGQGGVFLRLPDGARAFLRETGGLAPGQRVLVQVTGFAEPGKAVPVTLRLLFKSRLSIATPGAPGINISRRIRDDDLREHLGALAATAMAGADEALGLIVRSAAADAADADLAEDFAVMRKIAEAVLADVVGEPELLLDGAGPQDIAFRDWTDPAPDAVEQGDEALATQDIHAKIEALLSPDVVMAAGGRMSIEPTRALVAVDVNTGNDTSPAASLKANIAAARDLPRQLRLRGLGGMVTVDFAPMPKRDRATLEQQLRAAFKGEAAETSLAGWTPLGNYELQRKRDRMPLAEAVRGLLP